MRVHFLPYEQMRRSRASPFSDGEMRKEEPSYGIFVKRLIMTLWKVSQTTLLDDAKFPSTSFLFSPITSIILITGHGVDVLQFLHSQVESLVGTCELRRLSGDFEINFVSGAMLKKIKSSPFKIGCLETSQFQWEH